MLRFIQSALVTVFFLVMMVFLFQDHVIPHWKRADGIEIDQRVLTDSWTNQEDWYRIEFNGQPIGTIHSVADRNMRGEGNYTVASHVVIDRFVKARIIYIAKMNRKLELEYARARIHIAPGFQEPLDAAKLWSDELVPGVFEVATLVDGRKLLARFQAPGVTRFFDLPIDRPITMADSVTPIFRNNMLTKGKTYVIDVYEPITQSTGQVHVTYVDEEYELIDGKAVAIRQVEMKMGAMVTRMKVDPQGVVLRREIPLSFGPRTSGDRSAAGTIVMERLDPILAMNAYPSLAFIPEVPEYTAAQFQGENTGDPQTGTSILGIISPKLLEIR